MRSRHSPHDRTDTGKKNFKAMDMQFTEEEKKEWLINI